MAIGRPQLVANDFLHRYVQVQIVEPVGRPRLSASSGSPGINFDGPG